MTLAITELRNIRAEYMNARKLYKDMIAIDVNDANGGMSFEEWKKSDHGRICENNLREKKLYQAINKGTGRTSRVFRDELEKAYYFSGGDGAPSKIVTLRKMDADTKNWILRADARCPNGDTNDWFNDFIKDIREKIIKAKIVYFDLQRSSIQDSYGVSSDLPSLTVTEVHADVMAPEQTITPSR